MHAVCSSCLKCQSSSKMTTVICFDIASLKYFLASILMLDHLGLLNECFFTQSFVTKDNMIMAIFPIVFTEDEQAWEFWTYLVFFLKKITKIV